MGKEVAVHIQYGIFSSVQSFSHVLLLVTPWTAACQASLSITNFQSLLKLTSIESVMPSILMAESEEELKSFVMKVKEESEKVGL